MEACRDLGSLLCNARMFIDCARYGPGTLRSMLLRVTIWDRLREGPVRNRCQEADRGTNTKLMVYKHTNGPTVVLLHTARSRINNSHRLSNCLQPHPCLLSPLNERDRGRIHPPPMNHIDRSRKANHTDPHHRRPICRARRHRHGIREATEYDYKARIQKCERVDRQTPSAKAPPGWRQFLFSDTLEQDAADGDHVCGEESEQGQGDDDVEGCC